MCKVFSDFCKSIKHEPSEEAVTLIACYVLAILAVIIIIFIFIIIYRIISGKFRNSSEDTQTLFEDYNSTLVDSSKEELKTVKSHDNESSKRTSIKNPQEIMSQKDTKSSFY